MTRLLTLFLPLCAAAMLLQTAQPALAKVFLTTDEGLKLAFPGCRIDRQTAYLTPAQKAEVERLAGSALAGQIAYPYRATCAGKLAGTAWFDAHRVRTQSETLMIIVDPGARVRRIEVLSFQEPVDYLPRTAWYVQFEAKGLGPELDLKKGIRPVAGATLTARATTEAVRRVLALHQVLGLEAKLQ